MAAATATTVGATAAAGASTVAAAGATGLAAFLAASPLVAVAAASWRSPPSAQVSSRSREASR
ncbi:hypothetical protein NKG05_16610 [Oerskovia sp. M15]